MEKTYTFVNIDLINPDDLENSKIVTIELTANQIITHSSRNTELWKKYVPIQDAGLSKESIDSLKNDIHEEELDNQRGKFIKPKVVNEVIDNVGDELIKEKEINLLEGDFDPFLSTLKPMDQDLIEKQIKQPKPKGKRGRKPKK